MKVLQRTSSEKSSEKITLILDPHRRKVFRATQGILECLGASDDFEALEKDLGETHICDRRSRGRGWIFSDWVER